MLDLTGCRAKIERAKKHIVDFSHDKVAFLDTNPYVVISKFNAETNQTESIMGPMPQIPDALATIAGDAIQNLRSALDYLAAALVVSVGNVPKFVYFPICETLKKYEAESPGKTKGMPPKAKEFIDSKEPYGGGNGNDLWILHTLNNTDKHKLLTTIGVNIAKGFSFTLSPGGNTITALVDAPGLDEGDILGSISGNYEGEHRIHFTFDIAFGQPDSIAGDPVLPALEYLASMVETIVEEFEQEFKA
jgi:hypothetical protein